MRLRARWILAALASVLMFVSAAGAVAHWPTGGFALAVTSSHAAMMHHALPSGHTIAAGFVPSSGVAGNAVTRNFTGTPNTADLPRAAFIDSSVVPRTIQFQRGFGGDVQLRFFPGLLRPGYELWGIAANWPFWWFTGYGTWGDDGSNGYGYPPACLLAPRSGEPTKTAGRPISKSALDGMGLGNMRPLSDGEGLTIRGEY